MTKPAVLILGGLGFIGRNLAEYLMKQGTCSFIRCADKALIPTANLNPTHKKLFESNKGGGKLDTTQSNLTNINSIKNAFTKDLPSGVSKFNIVFNLAGETKYGQTEEVYKEKVLDLVEKNVKAAKEAGVDRWIELSTAQIYSSSKKPSKENGKIKPWTKLALYKYKCEEFLSKAGIDYVVLRAPIVYGPGDFSGITPRIITGAVYKHLGEKMKLLWSKDLKINTVHVIDVCRALWEVCNPSVKSGSTYNLCDKGNTSQQTINQLLEKVFGIKTGFQSGMINTIAGKLNPRTLAEEINDKHLKPWSDLCKENKILNTPLTPYLDPELLSKNYLCVDGTAIESAIGFKYTVPKIQENHIRESIEYFASQGLFPPINF